MITKDDVRGIIRDSLNLEDEELNEALVLQQKQFDLPTELLSQKNSSQLRKRWWNTFPSSIDTSPR